jgi:hypothetical protein
MLECQQEMLQVPGTLEVPGTFAKGSSSSCGDIKRLTTPSICIS